MWMRNERMRKFISNNRVARALSSGLQTRLQLMLLGGHKDPLTVARLKACRAKADSLLSGDEAFMVHELAAAQSQAGGAFAEFGVYRGCSARLIAEVKGDAPLHLFDTFAGLPDPDTREGRVFASGQFHGSLPGVQKLLAPYQGVHFHEGLFPGTTLGLENLRFSFVHLDVDLKDATLAGLEFFYPRMMPGGVILTHDYSIISGVAEAFDIFFASRPERVIELPTTQAMVICTGTAAVAFQAEAA